MKRLTREELLARDLADGLGDLQNLSHYLAYARRHPEALLRRCLGEARAVAEREIKKSRAALFEHLLKQHAEEGTQDPGH